MLAVRCYGHFWSKDSVDWGRKGKGGSGRLFGYYMSDRKPYKIDFEDQIAVYVLFDKNREVVYVGQTGSGDQRLLTRLRQHSQGAIRDRWTHFSWFGLREAVDSDGGRLSNQQTPDSNCRGTNSEALDEIEAVLLQILEPLLNKQGPSWGKDTIEYLQYLPWEFEDEREPPVDSQTDAILRKIEKLENLVNDISRGSE